METTNLEKAAGVFDVVVRTALQGAGALCMLAGIGGSLLLLGFQLLAYLKDGFWTGISVLDAVRYVSPQSPYSWINSPSEWLGVHAILSAAPAAVAGLLGGLLVGVLLSSLAEKID